MSHAPRLPVLAVGLIAAWALAGCGEHNTRHASDEGTYIDVGALKYQVQLSRQLNPTDAEDRSYLLGLTPPQAHLTSKQAWFSVWLRVENHSCQTRHPALIYRIKDTQGRAYTPVVPGPLNIFAYRPLPIPCHGQIPAQSTVPDEGPIQGAVLLFKVPVSAYDNRPLEFDVSDQVAGQTGTVELDV
ncbi:MAG: hypothetical protein E6G56_02480 [Actinobacteria bacterium]|nr:MAG: hypothetical protein E6G56_02480 [Actinomycetota bacterium]